MYPSIEYDADLLYDEPNYLFSGWTLYGFPGSTLRDELNRLANSGTYPPYTEYLDETGAVNKWAGTEMGLGFVASLNHKADPDRPPYEYKERNAVANELAGITDPADYVEIVTALRTIES